MISCTIKQAQRTFKGAQQRKDDNRNQKERSSQRNSRLIEQVIPARTRLPFQYFTIHHCCCAASPIIPYYPRGAQLLLLNIAGAKIDFNEGSHLGPMSKNISNQY